MKRKLLMLTLALACLLCLFAVQAAATGNDTPALAINFTNLSFKDSVYIKYAVAADNVAPEDVRLLVFTEPQSDYKDTTKATVLNPKYLDTVNGAEHIIFDYTNLSAKQMTDVVYARAMVEVDGHTYYSNVKKYSILEYAKAVENNASAKQTLKNLLAGMLDYGALAQKHFSYNTNRPANGAWVTVNVVNGTLSDGFTSGLYMTGDALTLTPAAASDGKVFSHWVNAAGEPQTLPLTAPTKNETYTAVYVCAHNAVTEHEAQEATCTEIGWDAYVTCDDCDYTTYVEKAAGHDEINHEAKAPTATEDGWDAYVTCTRCDYTTLVVKPATGSLGLVYAENTDGNSYKVTGIGTCTDTDVIIPQMYNGLPVTSINSYAFKDCTRLTSITIPDSVTSIGSYAFYNCTSLASVEIPDGVTSIGNRVFSGCISLTSITIPDGVANLGEYVFSSCTSLASITIPDSVTSFGEYAFYNCTSLKSVTFGEDSQLASIGLCSFHSCASLASIEIPDSVTSISISAFYGCRSLTNITIPDSVTSIGERAFSGCTSLASITIPFVGGSPKTATDTYQYPFGYIFGDISYTGGVATKQYYHGSSTSSSTSTTYYIPSTLQSVTITGGNILYGAFYNCTGLISITIGDDVTSIGSSAFRYCKGLKRVTLGEKSQLTSIDYYAFAKCTSLASIEIPDGVTSIGESAFYGCTSLACVTFDENSQLTTISKSALHDCLKLTSVEIPNSVTSIGDSAFYGCKSLASITIPDSVTSIGSSAFWGCTNLVSIEIPDTTINEKAFYGCTSLATVTFAEGSQLTSIGESAFSGCTSLERVTFSEKSQLTSIGKRAFAGCKSLISIIIPDSVASIGFEAFNGCTILTSVTFGEKSQLMNIDSYAFQGCTSLKIVYYGETETDWSGISINSSGNSYLTSATRYYYSVTQPTEAGNYWHYVDGEPTAW